MVMDSHPKENVENQRFSRQENPKDFLCNTAKCCRNDCASEAVGYFHGAGFGLFLCEKHKNGKLKTPISEIRNNPDKKHCHNMYVEE